MIFTVEKLIKFLETFPKDSKICFVTETERKEVLPNVFEGGYIKSLEIKDIQEDLGIVYIAMK